MPIIGIMAAHHTTHENGGSDEIDISGLTGATEIVDTPADGETTKGISSNWAYDHRADAEAHHVPSAVFVDRGDPSGYDFTHVDMTLNGNWFDLNLSSIVPAGTLAVLFFVMIYTSGVNHSFKLRKKGNVNNYNIENINSQVAGGYLSANMIVSPDSNRIIEYSGFPGDIGVYLTVRGWWIK